MQFPRPNAVALGGRVPQSVSLSLPDEPHDDGSVLAIPTPQCAPSGAIDLTKCKEVGTVGIAGIRGEQGDSGVHIREVALKYLASISKHDEYIYRWLIDKGLAIKTEFGIKPTERGVELLKTLDYL